MKNIEEIRIKRDYDNKVGFTGKWLVQHRLLPLSHQFENSKSEGWQTIYSAESRKEAQTYVEFAPLWAFDPEYKVVYVPCD